jgi:hypothetical protein
VDDQKQEDETRTAITTSTASKESSPKSLVNEAVTVTYHPSTSVLRSPLYVDREPVQFELNLKPKLNER